MTGESARIFTDSQEQRFLQDLPPLQDFVEIDDNCGLFDGLSQELPQDFHLNGNLSFGQPENNPLAMDEKVSLQQQLGLQDQTHTSQQYQHHQQQQQQQQHQPQQLMHPHFFLPQTLPPLSTPILGKEEFAGKYNFQLIFNPKNSGKHWVYSEKLAKVFIHMEQVLPLSFQWNPPVDGLWVRATMVYKLDQHRSQPVVRCHNHMAPDNNSNRNINPMQVKHVIRCLHNTSSYEEANNGHLSVLTPLGVPETALNNVPMDFLFTCKNSCSSGMNRRATELIFTLEDESSQILGRRKLEVRVCSCPKRDKEKEEKEESGESGSVPLAIGQGKKRKIPNPGLGISAPPGKKIAMDNKVYNISFNVIGKDTYNACLRSIYNTMAGQGVQQNNLEAQKPFMEEILKKINEM
ncbi:hypothetical protein TKK_0014905 [Trichogramma kaykai]|uniref:p53 DNA-binding domain-containing protein n=1 Tax=Trichogramma kaykai TaxID=54128 RepID=A0ABD2WBJ3_9HYME